MRTAHSGEMLHTPVLCATAVGIPTAAYSRTKQLHLGQRETPYHPCNVTDGRYKWQDSETVSIHLVKLKNVSCEYDRLNGGNSTLPAARYIRRVRIIWFL